MDFTAIQGWANQGVLALQLLGGALIGLCVAYLALSLVMAVITGHPAKVEQVRTSFVVLVVGIMILALSNPIAGIFRSMAGLNNPGGTTPPAQTAPKP
ncbi:hypothetical protein KDA_76850 [Dictyobacter alpinus]|uniref:Uncharacterized protein n=1 Tax=Dictyobacter alpinus TaxID=2014873 RepID=A0A402BLH6_9CHLR|nr:hypothetical protein [Dictyobacter alpinus]GCE32201.1 hypothetical protein KDA_76850 [Dictyobacter alpinus]